MPVDATKPTDQELVSALPSYIRDIATLLNEVEADVAAGDESRLISDQNTDKTFILSELNQVYLINSGSAVVLTLPVVTATEIGLWVRFQKFGAGNLTITPGGTDAIAGGGNGESIANTTAGDAKMAFIELECVGNGQWLISGILGTWS